MMRRPLALLPLLACAALMGACGSSSTDLDHPDWSDPAKIDFYSGLGIDLSDPAWVKTTDGVYYRDTAIGTGAPADTGFTVLVTYTGWLPDGTQFDSNVGSATGPFQVEIGGTDAIPGFEEGLVGIKEGGVRKLVIPPQLAYGPGGSVDGRIPPDATIVFEVTANKVSGP